MSNLESEAIEIVKTLRSNGHEAYFVGGCVRDKLLNKKIQDIDITTSATPQEVSLIFKKTLGVGAKFGVMIVITEQFHFEVATFRNDGAYIDGRRPESVQFSTAKDDVQRRDFTINGLLLDPIENKIIDYVEGQIDLNKKTIRAIGDPAQRFQEDHLRMLRAVRFAARFDFKLETKTREAILKLKHNITLISKERITDEITKMLSSQNKSIAIGLLSETELLKVLFGSFHEKFWKQYEVFLQKFDELNLTIFIWTLTADFDQKGTNISFTASIQFDQNTEKISKGTLCLSNVEVKALEELQHCMKVLPTYPTLSVSKKMRFLLSTESKNAMQIEAQSLKYNHLDWKTFLSSIESEKQKFIIEKGLTELPKPLLDGNEIMALGVKPGPSIKNFKEDLIDLQLEEKINTKEQAITYIRDKNRTKK